MSYLYYQLLPLLLLKSIAGNAGFDINRFASHWQEFFKTYEGYFDGATKATLENFAAGKGPADAGSDSDDLAGAACGRLRSVHPAGASTSNREALTIRLNDTA